ncbi:MAG: aldehyde dehydrogenase family protein [Firmicutes bacterium]|nr:aldehyde dehydrogenase family protein [Bacillota bacterium]
MATAVEATPRNIPTPRIRQTQCFIGGQWVPAQSGKTFETINPATEEVLASVAEGDAADVDLAVQAARKAFESGDWPKMDARDRGRLIARLADLIEEEKEELAALESLDNGKPIRDALNADLPLTIDCLRYYAGYADKIHGQTIPIRGNYFCYTRKEPVGVVGQIIPWNFPMLMVAWKWGPALAAGCTIVMKPAEQTPLTCLRMARLAQKAGFPDGVINVIPGFGPTAGAAIVRHPGIDKIAFTGSTEVGKRLMAAASAQLKRVSFELGGNAPFIVFDDADLAAAAEGAVAIKFLRVAGQSCICANRVYVQERVADRFLPLFIEKVKGLKVAAGFDPGAQIGPLINREILEKVDGLVQAAVADGARVVAGGRRLTEGALARGLFYAPTVLVDVREEMAVAREEIFGPVAPVMTFRDEAEVIARANATTYGLAAYFYTADLRRAIRVAEALEYGMVGVNDATGYTHEIPFGGFKESGLGREGGRVGIEEYTEVKSISIGM